MTARPPDDTTDQSKPTPRPRPADGDRRRRSLTRQIDYAIAARRRAVERLDALARELAALDADR